MHIEDLLFSVKGKIIAERNSNLGSCTRAWYCRYLLGAALNYIIISRLELHISCSVPHVLT